MRGLGDPDTLRAFRRAFIRSPLLQAPGRVAKIRASGHTEYTEPCPVEGSFMGRRAVNRMEGVKAHVLELRETTCL